MIQVFGRRRLPGLCFALKSIWLGGILFVAAASPTASFCQMLDGSRVAGVGIREIYPSATEGVSSVGGGRTAEGTHLRMTSGSYGARPGYSTPPTPATPAYLSTTVEVLSDADTSRQAQQDAVNLIPWNDLNQEGRRKIKEVIDHPSLFRRLPVSRIQCDPQFYQFSIRNPETIVGLWQVFGVTSMGLQRTGPYTFAGNDGAGTECTAELVYGDHEKHIYVGSGSYEGPVFRRKVSGRCVAILKTETGSGRDNISLTNQLDIFLRVDNLAADLIARTLQPMVGRTADHNFNESLLFLQAFSETAAREPERVEHLVRQLQHLEPVTRNQFHQVVATVQPRQQKYLQARIDQQANRLLGENGAQVPHPGVQANSAGDRPR